MLSRAGRDDDRTTIRSDHSDLDDLDSESLPSFHPRTENFSLVSLASMKNVLLVWYLKFDKVDKSYEKVINWSCPGFGRTDMMKRPQMLQIFKRFARFMIVERSLTPQALSVSIWSLLLPFIPHRLLLLADRWDPTKQQPFGYWTNNFPFCFASWFLSKYWLLLDFVFSQKPFYIFASAHTFVWFCFALLLLLLRL